MGAAKKGRSTSPSAMVPPVLDKLVRWAAGPGRPVALLLLVAGLFFGGWYAVWRSVGPWLLDRRDYRVTIDTVEITPLPPWIHATDIRREAFLYASLDRKSLSITDDDLVEQVRKAFSVHPWVAKVVSVRKYHPARIKVELVYRRPVCMVRADEERIPIDAEGVVLPGDELTPVEKERYPKLIGIDKGPPPLVGSPWADPRVAGGAEIAAALSGGWDRLGLDRIVVSGSPGPGPARDSRFYLVTVRGTEIPWGRAPSSEAPGEPTPAEKVARLEAYLKDHGTLDRPSGEPGGPDLISRIPSSSG